ncbi:MAG: 1,4-dihydroxy-2-naphthoate octaprenyltransferase, partial [Bacteroidales bacterium]|nr:1,4-dihydroxy-2-naphthoate octaprenyltransferase [Bacteroidales bacterium]
MKAQSIIKSMRLRTLPLSLSGIILGFFLASDTFSIKPLSVVFLILTAVFLQILSNLSNELGDSINGLDTKARKGMHYSIQDGEMTVDQMRTLIAVIILACCASGLLMIWSCFGNLMRPEALLFVALGACAIAAAMRYTLGRNPYGYRGLGDIFVFIFFGLVTVCGAYILLTQSLPEATILLPASSIGFLSVAVLNVNNIRDMKTDAGKRITTAIRLG